MNRALGKEKKLLPKILRSLKFGNYQFQSKIEPDRKNVETYSTAQCLRCSSYECSFNGYHNRQFICLL